MRKVLGISLFILLTIVCNGQPYLSKAYVFQATGHSPTSILMENDGYVVASRGWTEEVNGFFLDQALYSTRSIFRGIPCGEKYTMNQERPIRSETMARW